MPSYQSFGDIFSKVDVQPNGCWVWTGYIANTGYGSVSYQGKDHLVHRLIYEVLKGNIRDTLDHLCRNKPCCNIAHLEDVTQRENSLRGMSGDMIYECPQGHLYDEENTGYQKGKYGFPNRYCKTCRRERAVGKKRA